MSSPLATESGEAAAELLAMHLGTDGLQARAIGDQVATGIGAITVRFRVEDVAPSGGRMMVAFWATIDGVRDLPSSPIQLDLIGLGGDGHEALAEGVHALVDGVIPVLRRDVDAAYERDELSVLPVTSVTGRGPPRAWDLVLGPPAYGGAARDRIKAALDDLVLYQGIMDSITPVLDRRVAHWFKLFLARGADGKLAGDVKVDGVAVGVAHSFETADWTGIDEAAVRQFGLIRPSDRPVDVSTAADLAQAHGAPSPGASWWRRLLGR